MLRIDLIPIGGNALVTANAYLFALSTSLLLYAFTRLRGVSSETMVLVGIALLFTFNGIANELWLVLGLKLSPLTVQKCPPKRPKPTAGKYASSQRWRPFYVTTPKPLRHSIINMAL